MSKLSIHADLFLGAQELNRWQSFIFDQGFVKALLQDSMSFGIVNCSIDDGVWNDFKVEQGSVIGNIKINTGVAIDINGKFITWSEAESTLANDNVWRWIKIKHVYDTRESYTVEIDRNGNLFAANGDFLSTLRGTNIPVRVMFSNATLNIQEYDVVEVIDDEHAILAGNFVAESNLRMDIIGSFTPGTVTPTESKFPYQYDGVIITAVVESSLNTPPTLMDGEEFLIARVKRNGSSILIEDKRPLSIYRSKADYDLSTVTRTTNPLIGVEQITYFNKRSPRNENVASIGFGFRSSNWTFSSSINTVTILGGNGGIFHDTSFFNDGDFDGWRLYFKSGRFAIVKQSSVSALQINLVLSDLDPDELNIDLTQQITIVPNADAIEIIAKVPNGESTITETRFQFPINEGEVKVLLPIYEATLCQYILSYRYKSLKTFSEELLFPDDAVGYLRETSFDEDGVITGNIRLPYNDGVVTLLENPSAYQNVINSVSTGQLFGVEYVQIDTTIDPVIRFVVGTRKEHVIITNDDDLDTSDSDFGAQYVLTADTFLDLRTDTPTTLKNGNNFLIQFQGDYDPDGFSLFIVQDYVNGGDVGDILYTFTDDDFDQARIANLVFRIYYDGERWAVRRMSFLRENVIDTVHIIDQAVTNGKIANSTILAGKIADGQVTKSNDARQLLTKVIDIGVWDMDATSQVNLSHGLGSGNQANVVGVNVIIRADNLSDGVKSLDVVEGSGGAGTQLAGSWELSSTQIVLRREAGGLFDALIYNDTGINRGYVLLTYLA